MMEIIESMKEHPYVVAGGIAAFVLILFAGNNDSGGNAGIDPVEASLKSQAIASETNVALGTISAKLAAINTSAATERYMANTAASLARDLTHDERVVDVLTTMYHHDETLKQIKSERFIQAKEINAKVYEARKKFELDDKSLTYQHIDLPRILRNKLKVAEVAGATAADIARINSYASNTSADAASRSSDEKSDMAWVGTAIQVAGTIAAFL